MRPAVARFADRMEQRLAKYDEERGAIGWRGAETQKLISAMNRNFVRMGKALSSKDKDAIIKQATDAANYLMMIVDNVELGTEGAPPPDSDGS